MIARLFILLPFQLTVPEGELFTVYEYEDSGYKVRFYPPSRSDRAPLNTELDQFKINGILHFKQTYSRSIFIKRPSIGALKAPVILQSLLLTEPLTRFLLACDMLLVPRKCAP